MGVSLGASGMYLSRTASLPSSTAWTVAGWVKIRSIISGPFQYFFDLESSGEANYQLIGYNESGNCVVEGTVSETIITPAPASGTWLFFYLRCFGTGGAQLEGGYAQASATAFSYSAYNGELFTAASFMIGNDLGAEYSNIDVRGIRLWNTSVSQANLLLEMASTSLVNSTSINAFWDLPSAGNYNDSSGNGHTLTVGGSPTTSADDPSIYAQNINIAWWYI